MLEIEASSRLQGDVDSPGYKRTIRTKRTRIVKIARGDEYAYSITSLNTDQGDAETFFHSNVATGVSRTNCIGCERSLWAMSKYIILVRKNSPIDRD